MRYRYVGLGEEAQHGTAVPAAVLVDAESTSLDPPEEQMLLFTGASGLQRQVAAGPYQIEGDISLLVDDIVAGWWWKWLLGRYATVGTAVGGGLNTTLTAAPAAGATQITVAGVVQAVANDYIQVGTGNTAEVHKIQAIAGNNLTLATPLRFAHAVAETVTEVAAPYTHTFSHDGRTTLVPFTTRVGKDLFEHVFSGCVISEAEISIEDTLILASLSLMASHDAKAALPAAVEYSEGNIFAPHQVNVMIDNADESDRVETITLSISNNGELGRATGSRFPNRGYRGEFAVSGELQLAFLDMQELERYWNNAAGPGTTLSEFPLSISIGPNMDIVFPRVVYGKAGQPLEGPERIKQTVGFTALVDGAGDGPIQVTLVNNLPQYGG